MNINSNAVSAAPIADGDFRDGAVLYASEILKGILNCYFVCMLYRNICPNESY